MPYVFNPFTKKLDYTAPGGGGSPTGAAGGSLSGTYPNPGLSAIVSAGSVGSSSQIPVLTINAEGRITAYTTAAPAGGSGISIIENASIPVITASSVSSDTVLITNVVAIASITVTKMYFFCTSTAAGDQITLGIYNESGTTLLSSGFLLSASIVVGLNVVTITSLALTARTVYRFALKGETGAVSFGSFTSVANASICSSLFSGATGLPASTSGSTSNTVAPYIAAGV